MWVCRVLYHYIGWDYRWRLNIMLLVKCQWQTCCLSRKLRGWYVTSEMRSKMRAADWRRASEITGGISCWAGPCDSGRWSLDVVESRRMFAVESEPYINPLNPIGLNLGFEWRHRYIIVIDLFGGVIVEVSWSNLEHILRWVHSLVWYFFFFFFIILIIIMRIQCLT